LNCHNSYPEYVEFTENKFRTVPHGIGCERCHGPGELHVKKWSEQFIPRRAFKDKTWDSTIVNPGHLDFKRQLDVCFQCHLQGDVNVFKDGRKQTDFRPGLELGDIKAVYFRAQVSEGDFRIASHGARMVMSECFKRSGKLLCTTCHDPHVPVKSVTRIEFNDKCKMCHSVESLPGASENSPASGFRKKVDHRENADCVSCHMRQGGTSDIPHVNFTDHWIRKEIRVLTKNQMDSAISLNDVITLKEFHNPLAPPELKGDEAEVNLGIAYVKYYEEKHNHPDYLNRAVPMLERGLYYFPENKEAMYYLGAAYMHLKKYNEAERTFRKLIAADSRNAPAYYQLGTILENQNRLNEAIEQFQKAVELVPDNYKAFNSLGNIYAQIGNRDRAIESYQKAIEIMPMYAIVFNNLGDLYFHQLNDTTNARKYIQTALQLDPDFTMAILNLANLTLMEGNEDYAEKLLKEIIRIDDKFIPAYGNLAVIYKKKGKKQEAVKCLNKVLELNPNDRNARRMLEEMK
jgi:tetratricopeptide (TPR) repeat protein